MWIFSTLWLPSTSGGCPWKVHTSHSLVFITQAFTKTFLSRLFILLVECDTTKSTSPSHYCQLKPNFRSGGACKITVLGNWWKMSHFVPKYWKYVKRHLTNLGVYFLIILRYICTVKAQSSILSIFSCIFWCRQALQSIIVDLWSSSTSSILFQFCSRHYCCCCHCCISVFRQRRRMKRKV